MLQLLSFYLLFSRYGIVQDVYIALGKANYLTAINITKLISLFVVVPLLYYFYGQTGAIIGAGLYLISIVPLIFWLNRSYSLNNFRFEILILGLWPIGWGAGLLANVAIDILKP